MQEIPIKLIYKTISWRRLLNAARGLIGLQLSALSKRSFVWGRPFILTVEPTNICNLKCPLCVTGNGQMTRQTGMMTLDTFKKTIDEVGQYLFYLLLYQQGEPYLNPEFLNFVRYAKQKRIFVTSSTNGHYLGSSSARETVASGLDSLIISVDGTTQTSYEKYRVKGELEKVKQGIRNLVTERQQQQRTTPVIFLQFIVMRHNEHEIAQMEKLTKELGADKLLIKTVQIDSVNSAAEWLPRSEKYRRYSVDETRLQPKRLGTGPCSRPWTSALVNWDGSVVPCCFDKNADHATGNINNSKTISRIWNSKKYAAFRKKMLTNRSTIDICANCSQGLRLYI